MNREALAGARKRRIYTGVSIRDEGFGDREHEALLRVALATPTAPFHTVLASQPGDLGSKQPGDRDGVRLKRSLVSPRKSTRPIMLTGLLHVPIALERYIR